MAPRPGWLDQHFSSFLRARRGEGTYAALSRATGVPIGTLHRLEMGQQSATLRLLEQVLRRLKASPADVFPADWQRTRRPSMATKDHGDA